MIEVKGVSKTYNASVKAVNDLSFSVEKGEIVGFIGPNGSGKTTTMKMITGILPYEEGEITVNGYDITKQPLLAKQQIGYISDSPDMFLRLKGSEFLNLMADIYQVETKERKERIEELTNTFGISHVLDSPMISYSHGMRQKMMVVAALLHHPPVWILDEPLTGLDPKASYELKKRMREHASQGNAVLFSTHVLEVAEKLCDRVVIIYKGNKLYDGTLENLQAQYPEQSLEEIFLTVTENGTSKGQEGVAE